MVNEWFGDFDKPAIAGLGTVARLAAPDQFGEVEKITDGVLFGMISGGRLT